VVILGSCSAVAVPNLLTAMERSKQKRTMADMRSIATAIEAFETDHPDWKPSRRGYLAANLASLLQPKYIKQVPARDGWNRPFHIALWTEKGEAAYRIWSLGKDGKRDAKWGGAITKFDNDLVYENGTFAQFPEGI